MKLIRGFGVIAVFAFSSIEAAAGPLCAYTKAKSGSSHLPPSPEALRQTNLVNYALCQKYPCPNYQLWRSEAISNASATMDATGNRVSYNAGFMAGIQNRYSNYATIGIFGHELGHLIDFNLNPSSISGVVREARADQYAGCAFAIAGEPKQNLIYLAQTLQSLGTSPGYPTPQQRVALLEIGYDSC